MTGLCSIALAGSSFAQSPNDMNNRLSRIENELQTISRAVFKGQQPDPSFFASSGADAGAQADFEVRLTQIENDLRALTGKLEEQNHQMMQLSRKVEQAQSAAVPVQVQGSQPYPAYGGPGNMGAASAPATPSNIPPQPVLTAPGQSVMANPDAPVYSGGPMAAGQLGTLSGAPGGPVSAVPGDPTALYEQAFSLLRDGRYDEAETQFRSFLDSNPGSDLAPNALYWLGETYYVRGKFTEAARVFAEAYQKYPKGSKAPDNLLKMGMSLAGMGKTKDACVALKQLQREYPNGAGPVLQRGEQEMSRLSCQ